MTAKLIEIDTKLGEPVRVGENIINPVARVVRVQLPITGIHGGLIWNRPLAVVVKTPGGGEHVLPVRDETRIAQLLWLGAGLLGAMFIWRALRKR